LATHRELHVKQRAAEFTFIEANSMRNLITTMLASAVLAGMTFGMIGCTEETGSKEEIKTTTPGGTSKETREIKVQKSGDNPPAAPSETAKP
jgi:hypothetical protein